MESIYPHYELLICLSFVFNATDFAAQPVAAEVSQAEFQALLQRVEQLEGLLRVTRNAQVEKIAQEAAAQMPMAAKDRQSFIEDVGALFKRRKRRRTILGWMHMLNGIPACVRACHPVRGESPGKLTDTR